MNRTKQPCLAMLAPVLLLAAVGGRAPGTLRAEEVPRVEVLRVPGGGIQPQAEIDEKGILHLIYFTGDPGRGDVHHVRSADGGKTFSEPLRVNSVEGSAIAAGNIRGAQLALGRGGRPHVAWMGSDRAQPRAAGGEAPMLYARLDGSGDAFEPQRNVIQARPGLDGGGSVAADREGNVYVVWHAPGPGARGEGNRRVWVARSRDDGKTFDPEKAAFEEPTGACGCCGLRAFADSRGRVAILYRSAAEQVHRDMYLLLSRDGGERFAGEKIHPWEVGQCVMSTAHLSESAAGLLAAWETEEQVYLARLDPATLKLGAPVAAPGDAKRRKHPAAAGNRRGEAILAWTEGMGWQRGGSLHWQVFDRGGRPIPAAAGKAAGVPVWSLVAAIARPDGSFAVIY